MATNEALKLPNYIFEIVDLPMATSMVRSSKV
jgi:hypothetical protein